MKFIGNYKDWIDPKVIDYIMTHDGTPRPSGGRNPNSQEFVEAAKVGYDMSMTYWYIYEPDTLPFDITPPIEHDGNIIWWFIKMLPGNIMPMHRDPHVSQKENCTRYWMPMQDYQPGHVFIYDKELVVDYKAGDLLAYPDANEIHGACNIGYTPRITFLFTTHHNK